MEKLKTKKKWSLIIHIFWLIALVFLCEYDDYKGFYDYNYFASKLIRFLTYTDYTIKAMPVWLIMVYLPEILVYRIKPLETRKEKVKFWLFTAFLSCCIVVPILMNFFFGLYLDSLQ